VILGHTKRREAYVRILVVDYRLKMPVLAINSVIMSHCGRKRTFPFFVRYCCLTLFSLCWRSWQRV